MDIREIAKEKSYEQLHVNDECDRELYIDSFIDGANVMFSEIENWLRNNAERYSIEGGIAINSMISSMKQTIKL